MADRIVGGFDVLAPELDVDVSIGSCISCSGPGFKFMPRVTVRDSSRLNFSLFLLQHGKHFLSSTLSLFLIRERRSFQFGASLVAKSLATNGMHT
jgi:hypothetical protein